MIDTLSSARSAEPRVRLSAIWALGRYEGARAVSVVLPRPRLWS